MIRRLVLAAALAVGCAAPSGPCAHYGPAASARVGDEARIAPLPMGQLALAGSGDAAMFGGASVGPGVFVARLTPSGTALWARTFAGSRVGAIATDETGRIALAGTFSGTLDADGSSLVAGTDAAFVLLLDAGGHVERAHAFAGVFPWSIALGPDGTVVLVGTVDAGLDLGAGPLTPARGLAVVALDSLGVVPWSRFLGAATAHDTHGAVLAEPDGTFVIAFSFYEAIDLETGTLTSVGGADVAVARLDAQGRATLARRFGGPADEGLSGFVGERIGLARAPDGRIAVALAAYGDVDFGDGPHAVRGPADGAVLVLDPTLAPAWSRTVGGDGFDAIGGIAVDDAGDIGLVGISESRSADGAFACGAPDALPIAVLDRDGTLAYSACYPGAFAAGHSVVLGPDGALHVAGFGEGTLDFGAGPLGDASTTLYGFFASFAARCQ